jgi:tetratricopeptide (TPR) repeat protein
MSGSTISRLREVSVTPRRAAPALRWLALGALLWCTGCGGDVESRMAEVRALQDVGQFAGSIPELREILVVAPDLPEANYRLGLALVQTGEASRAVWPLQKAMESSEYAATAGLLLASTHLQTRNFDEAVRAANRVLEEDPDRIAALRVRAMANLTGRKLDAALEDAERLKMLAPDDYAVRALYATVLGDVGKLEEAEKENAFVKELGQKQDDPNLRVRACLAPAVFAASVLEDDEKAKPLYEDCAQRNPTDPVTLQHIAGFFDKIGDRDRATQMFRASADSAPENLELQTLYAQRLRATGDVAGAEAVLTKSVESFGSAQAWNALATFYRGQRQPEQALHAIEKVVELSGKPSEAILFTHADVLLDLNQIDRAREVAAKLEQPAYASLIRGRLALLSGDPKTALAEFETGINAWPNNAPARFLAGLAARDLGDFERATSELREAVRAGREDTDAALELSRILLLQGRHKEAVSFATMALMGRGRGQPEPYVVAARAMTAQKDYDRARATLDTLRQFGFTALAASEQAVIERSAGGHDAAVRYIGDSGLDTSQAENLPLLQQLVESLTELGRHEQAIARIEAALATSPESHQVYELRGLTLARAGDAAGSAAAFRKAIELEPESAAAHLGLGTLTATQGDHAQAISLLDRSYALDSSNPQAAHAAAQLVLASGDREGAVERLRKVVQHHPDAIGARNDLAFLLAEAGTELDLALSLAETARERDPSPEVLDTLGWVRLQRGEHELAVAALEQAVAERPESATIRYHLAKALRASGNQERARHMLEAALGLGSFPEAEDARAELARLGS